MDGWWPLVNEDEFQHWAARFRQWHRLSKLVRVEPPTLPRKRSLLRALEREAGNDHRIRAALDAATARAHEKPGLIRRFVDPKDIRIY